MTVVAVPLMSIVARRGLSQGGWRDVTRTSVLMQAKMELSQCGSRTLTSVSYIVSGIYHAREVSMK